MSFMEIALLIIGVIIFVVSFLLPGTSEKKTDIEIMAEKEEVHRMMEEELDDMQLKVNEATNDTVEYAVDKAERSLEKISNEKIMAVNEYAGTVIEEINKNHKEVMFLYEMLKDKQNELNNAVRKADATVKEIEDASHSAQSASETLLRGMSVATVSQKGLTQEQKSVFDNVIIPEAEPVVFKSFQDAAKEQEPSAPSKPRGVALAQAKIFADLTGTKRPSFDEGNQQGTREGVAYDILSGGAFKEGTVINVALPAKGSVTAADFAALVGSDNGANSKVQDSVGEASLNNNDKIIELSRQGMDVVDIAKSLDLGVGEVKLVLDLFK